MGTVLAAEIVSRAAAMPIDTFAKKYLFDPLGVENVTWGHTAGNREVIPSARRLYITPRTMLKIGQLVLNKGMWEGETIVSKSWITEMVSSQTILAGLEYGFLWWRIPLGEHVEKSLAFTATGNGGQYIMVFPGLDLVAVFTGGAYNSDEDKLPFAIISDIILPTFAMD
jgi:CubicO group peptidase (beta-lactamase class C family)